MSSSRIESTLELVIVPWGIWTLYVQALVYARANFNDMMAWSPVPLLAGFGAACWLVRQSDSSSTGEQAAAPSLAVPHPYASWALLLATSVIWSVGWGPVASVAALAIACFGIYTVSRADGSSPAPATGVLPPPPGALAGRIDWLLAGAAVGFALLQVLFIVLPTVDDGFYLGSAVAALDGPSYALLRYDFYSGLFDPPVRYMVVHRPQSYELSLAALSWLTGIPVPPLYFLVAPVVAVGLWAAVNHALAARLIPAHAGAVLCVIAILLALWGDHSRTFGSFGFLRLHQGKVVLLSVLVPWIWLCAWRFAELPTVRAALALSLVQVAGVGLASVGAVIAPMAAGVAMIAAWLGGRCGWRRVAAAALLSLPAVWPIIFLLIESSGENITGGGGSGSVLGLGLRPAVVMAVLVALPLLFVGGRARDARLFGGIAVSAAAFLSPVMGRLFGLAANNISWRYVWAVPVPLLVAVGLIQLGVVAGRGYRNWAVLGVLVVSFAFGGRWTLSPDNAHWWGFQTTKVDLERLRVAQQITDLTPSSERVLMPGTYSNQLPMVRHHPAQWIGRKGYFRVQLRPVVGEEDIDQRREMQRFAEGKQINLSVERFVETVVAAKLHTVVIVARHSAANEIASALRIHGYFAHPGEGVQIFSRRAHPIERDR